MGFLHGCLPLWFCGGQLLANTYFLRWIGRPGSGPHASRKKYGFSCQEEKPEAYKSLAGRVRHSVHDLKLSLDRARTTKLTQANNLDYSD